MKKSTAQSLLPLQWNNHVLSQKCVGIKGLSWNRVKIIFVQRKKGHYSSLIFEFLWKLGIRHFIFPFSLLL